MPRSDRWKKRRLANDTPCEDNPGGGFSSVRGAYEALGSTKFYASHGGEYRNPHEMLLSQALNTALNKWLAAGAFRALRHEWNVIDLACGGGEASLALEAWISTGSSSSESANTYLKPSSVEITACDPYTAERYRVRTGRVACPWSFDDVAAGVLEQPSAKRPASQVATVPPYDMVLASFCLHLLDPPHLAAVLASLARSVRILVVATPHRHPIVEASTGWESQAGAEEVVEHDVSEETGSAKHRVRLRFYRSTFVCAHRA